MKLGDSEPKTLQDRPRLEAVEVAEREHKIRQFLTENLPPTEERIATPMDRNCKVVVVVPAYGERYTILQMIKSMSEQIGVTPDEYELIVVVNNSALPPKKRLDETDKDFARKLNQYDSAKDENQDILKLIGCIKDTKVDVELNEYEHRTIETIRSSGLRVYAIDKASQNKTLPEVNANVGGARNRGVAEAVERFFQQNRNGIVAQTDADTRPGKEYIRNLIKIFSENPKLVGVAGKIDMQAELGDKMIDQISLYDDVQYAYQAVLEDLLSLSGGEQVADHSIFHEVSFCGVNMASRAFEAAMVGGVPKKFGGEDTEFGQNLSTVGLIQEAPDVIVDTTIRFSARTAVSNGFGQRIIRMGESLETDGTIMIGNPESEIAIQIMSRKLVQAFENQQTDPKTFEEILQYKGVKLLSSEESIVLSNQITGITDMQKIKKNKTVRDIVDLVFQKIHNVTPKIPIEQAGQMAIEALQKNISLNTKFQDIKEAMLRRGDEMIEKNIEKVKKLFGMIHGFDIKIDQNSLTKLLWDQREELGIGQDNMIDRLSGNPTGLEKIVDAINRSSSAEQMLLEFEQIFPRELILIENNPIHLLSLTLTAMHEACKTSR